MSGSTQTHKKYPSQPEDIENEKDIVEEIKKLTPLPLKLKAFALNHHTLKLKELGAEEEEEIDKITAESQKNFQSYLPNINQIINGTKAPTDDELKDLDQYLGEEERAKKGDLLANLKPLPEYWFKVLINDPVIKNHVNENDEKALKHLTQVSYKFSEDASTPHNFVITMHFSANEFFENDVLTVHFHMQQPRDVTKTEGTEIKWKSGVNFTKKVVTKKQKNKKTGQMRTVSKEETIPSFFSLFKSVTAPDQEKELDENDMELQNEILDQVDIGYALVEEAIPFSLEYYLGVRKDFLPGEDDDLEGEDDDDDDDEEDAPKPKGKGKGGNAAKGAAKGGDQKQECKQQ